MKGEVLEAYFRNENGAIYYYNDKTQSPSLLMPSNPEKGFKWESTCGQYVYEIKSLDATLNTPHCEFKNLLKIEILNKSIRKKFQFFYKKGVGFVGRNIENRPHSFIKPNGTVENTSYIAYGCENLSNEDERRKCTSSKTVAFIRENLINPTPKKHGKVVYSFRINTEGSVDNIKVISNSGASKKQEKAGTNVLKNLPQFIPGKVGKKPIGVIVTIPIIF